MKAVVAAAEVERVPGASFYSGRSLVDLCRTLIAANSQPLWFEVSPDSTGVSSHFIWSSGEVSSAGRMK